MIINKLIKDIKKFFQFFVLATMILVVFFVAIPVVLAAWQGPTEAPPEGNQPGFIWNVQGTALSQPADINISSGQVIFPQICLPNSSSCISSWDEISAQDLDWTINGNNIYHEIGNVGIGKAAPASALDVAGDVQLGNNLATDSVGINVVPDANKLIYGRHSDSAVNSTNQGLYIELSQTGGFNTSGIIGQSGVYLNMDYSGTINASTAGTMNQYGNDNDIDSAASFQSGSFPNYVNMAGQNNEIDFSGVVNNNNGFFSMYGSKSDITWAGTNTANNQINLYGYSANVNGNIGNNGVPKKFGGSFVTSGTADVNYGIYASASGATANYAGYFSGNVAIMNGRLGINTTAPQYSLDIQNGGLLIYDTAGVSNTFIQNGTSRIYLGPSSYWLRFNDNILQLTSTGVIVTGNFTVSGGTKNFVQDHPTDPTKQIVYVSLEGPESGTYIRGSAQLKNGIATINLPDHFYLVTGEDNITVQITPTAETNGMYVAQKSNKQIVVKELNNGNGNATFDYLVNGVRKGYENHQVIIDKPIDLESPDQIEEKIRQQRQTAMDQDIDSSAGSDTEAGQLNPTPDQDTPIEKISWWDKFINFIKGIFK